MINLYSDNFIPPDPFFGLQGYDLQTRILPALCGPMGRLMLETDEEEEEEEEDDE